MRAALLVLACVIATAVATAPTCLDATVGTASGTGIAGTVNGNAVTTAQHKDPKGIAVDRSMGIVYVGDTNAVRKIENGVVSTLAGSGSGFADGPGSSALFGDIHSVDFLGAVVFVADLPNRRVRRIDALNQVSTIAYFPSSAPYFVLAKAEAQTVHVTVGDHYIALINLATNQVTTVAGLPGTSGFVNGVGTAARFSNPIGMAWRVSGSIALVDTNNHRIRDVTVPQYAVTVYAGGGSSWDNVDKLQASFDQPAGIAVDAADNMFIAERSRDTIRRIDGATGAVTTIAGSSNGFANGPACAAQFRGPFSVAVNGDGTLLVADDHNHRVRSISGAGVVAAHASSSLCSHIETQCTALSVDCATLHTNNDSTAAAACDVSVTACNNVFHDCEGRFATCPA